MPKKPVETEDENIYDEKQREEELEEDEISPAEAGFMEGHEDLENVECGECGKQMNMDEKVIERKVGEKTLWFCSEKCAELFDKRKEHD